MKLAVVGGGITGLAAAWEARDRAEVTIFEPARPGGKVLTTLFEGRPVDEGPDAFLTRMPAATELCSELGIASDLVAPAAGSTLLWWNGRLRPLPDGLVLGVPGRVGPLARSGILSPLGVARAGLDLVLPRRSAPAESSVWQLVAERFGEEVAERLVDPLVGSIAAGDTKKLSAASVTPQLVSAAERSRSLLLALRRPPSKSAGPVFLAPRPGMGEIVDALVKQLESGGVVIRPAAVESVRPAPSGKVAIQPDGELFDAAVVATPASVTARIVAEAGEAGLSLVEEASVSIVTAAFGEEDMTLPEGVNGFLVPRREGLLTTACSFASSKWPHWAGPGSVLLRLSAGRAGDLRAERLTDGELGEAMVAELGSFLGTGAAPSALRVSRWPRAFPQYGVGHGELVASVRAAVRRAFTNVELAGSAYGGVGVPACVASGRSAARSVLSRAGQTRERTREGS